MFFVVVCVAIGSRKKKKKRSCYVPGVLKKAEFLSKDKMLTSSGSRLGRDGVQAGNKHSLTLSVLQSGFGNGLLGI